MPKQRLISVSLQSPESHGTQHVQPEETSPILPASIRPAAARHPVLPCASPTPCAQGGVSRLRGMMAALASPAAPGPDPGPTGLGSGGGPGSGSDSDEGGAGELAGLARRMLASPAALNALFACSDAGMDWSGAASLYDELARCCLG